MQKHHLAWLKAHPDRSQEWLKDRFRDGFDVHHLDGNRENNSPNNLILLEHVDHMRVHKAEHLAIPRKELTAKINARTWRMIYANPIGPSPYWRHLGIPARMTVEWWDKYGDMVREVSRKNGQARKGKQMFNGLYWSDYQHPRATVN